MSHPRYGEHECFWIVKRLRRKDASPVIDMEQITNRKIEKGSSTAHIAANRSLLSIFADALIPLKFRAVIKMTTINAVTGYGIT